MRPRISIRGYVSPSVCPNFWERGSLSKLPEDQFPPSFWPPTSLSLHYLSINLYVRFTNPPTNRPTDGPVFSHLACLLPRSSDRPTNRRSHLSPASPSLRPLTEPLYEFLLLPDLRRSDRPTDRPSDRRSVGVVESTVWGTPYLNFTYSQTSDGPTDRRTDHRLVGVVESPVGNPSGAGVRFWTCRGQKNECRGFYLLRLPKTGSKAENLQNIQFYLQIYHKFSLKIREKTLFWMKNFENVIFWKLFY